MASISERASLIEKYKERVEELRADAQAIESDNDFARQHKMIVPKEFELAVERLHTHADELDLAIRGLETQITGS